MSRMNLEKSTQIVTNYGLRKNVLKIVVTDATTEIARSFVYRILTDNVFGEKQSLFVSLYELPDRATFLESVMIELTSFSPNRLNGLSYGFNASDQFYEADIIICIGIAREYGFKRDEYTDLFFDEHIRLSKFYGEMIEQYAKKNAKIVVLGNTAATIISKYAKSIPAKNITTLSLLNWNIAAAQISSRMRCLPSEIRNIIIWGSNGIYSLPDCRYIFCTNGKPVPDNVLVWIRNDLPRVFQSTSSRPTLIKSLAHGLAEHCKILWNGTPEREWTCMGVMSDHSYNVRSGIFFSYPVTCKDSEYQIVQGLDTEQYIKKYILDLKKLIYMEIQAAFKVCGIKPDGNI